MGGTGGLEDAQTRLASEELSWQRVCVDAGKRSVPFLFPHVVEQGEFVHSVFKHPLIARVNVKHFAGGGWAILAVCQLNITRYCLVMHVE